MQGIPNKTITIAFAEKKLVTSQKKIVGVFPFNYVIRFIRFHSMMAESGAHYPFIIINKDRRNKNGTHWWGLLNLPSKKRSFYWIVLVFKILRSSFFRMIKKYSRRKFMLLQKLTKTVIKLL